MAVLSDVSNRRSNQNDRNREKKVESHASTKLGRVRDKSTVSITASQINQKKGVSTRSSLRHLVNVQPIATRSSSRISGKREQEEDLQKRPKRLRSTKEREASFENDSLNAKKRRSKSNTESGDSKITGGKKDLSTKLTRSYLVNPDHRLERASLDGDLDFVGISPLDKRDEDSVKMVASYVTDIFHNLYAAEAESRPCEYMEFQEDINAKMRAILVDWLIEVHMKFRLVPETLHLCINIIDRYCSIVPVKRSKLQLVGITALLIACKYEEIYPPEVRDCVVITDRAYQRKDVLNMEQDIVHKLCFKITVPTAYPFLQRYLNLVKAPSLVQHAANYYMERTLQEHDMLCFKPSLVSASAVILALNNSCFQKSDDFTSSSKMHELLIEYTGFNENEITKCSKLIIKKLGEEPITNSRRQLVAAKRKYDNKKYQFVSTSFDLPTVKTIQSTSI